ncbi:hypothetical protein [Nocardioides okcheonensis]|uniref:hypothetical protein n=1 Tax=Nocardioides okcheonensis TaxID=2894081 RepID=UPI001E654618|nr:hypothetical protein [Nocardioides okcheonensis]UFN45594.1 hypothetical protein LN652_05125 [Nocardioides okcheonensis]
MPDHAAPRAAAPHAPSGVPLPRAAAAVLAATCTLQYSSVRPTIVMPLVLLVLALTCLWSLVARRTAEPVRPGLVVAVVAAVCALGVAGNAYLAGDSGVPAWLGVVLGALMAAGAAVAVWGGPSRRRLGLWVLLASFAVLAGARILLAEVEIDVSAFLRGGLDALLHGTSPYAITIDNPYGPVETGLFYGPGVVVDGVVQCGFPYLPAPLLLDVPAYLLGDARWMHLACLLVATAVAWHLATDALGRVTALVVVCGSTSSTVVIGYWVEPVMVGLLALTVVGMRSGRSWAAVPLGLLFASKQYAVSYVPALLSVARSVGWRTVVVAAAVGSVVLVPFVVWDLGAFVRSAVEFQFRQPFRDDAVSLLPGLKAAVGELPGWVLSLSPVLGLLTSALVAWRTRPGATAVSLGIALSLLVTVLTSKFGFMNYYAFISAAFVLAAVTWTTDDPVRAGARDDDAQTREPSSQGSRGERGISRTR